MRNFLQQTLAGEMPASRSGECAGLRWCWLDNGVLSVAPQEPVCGALVLSAGIHGNETAPVEMLSALLEALAQGEIPLRWRLLVVLGNPTALRGDCRYVANDMNRLFSGRWRGVADNAETQRAAHLEQTLLRFFDAGQETRRWHLDMHTALRESYYPRFGVLPAREGEWDSDFLRWLGDAGLQALVFHKAAGGTFTHFSSEQAGALSCTLELGKARAFGHNDLSQFAITAEALRALLSDRPAASAPPPRRYQVVQQLTKVSNDFVLHMSAQVRNFTAFPRGALLAQDAEIRYEVQHPCEYVLFPNASVATGLRAGLMLIEM
ncbi:succinylglutamate desuccinylase [Enterobacteriaceae bacterium 4M9]|nr:succinylglutamate desuccinylase [Enterobacteriaceae bacterium 4M9]